LDIISKSKKPEKEKMLKENLIQLFKSGDFTIAYYDNQEGDIYQGRIDDYDKLFEDDRVDDFTA